MYTDSTPYCFPFQIQVSEAYLLNYLILNLNEQSHHATYIGNQEKQHKLVLSPFQDISAHRLYPAVEKASMPKCQTIRNVYSLRLVHFPPTMQLLQKAKPHTTEKQGEIHSETCHSTGHKPCCGLKMIWAPRANSEPPVGPG